MNNKIVNVLMFLGGAAIGSVVTWKLIENKYKKIAQEEIDSVKEAFAARYSSEDTEDVEETPVDTAPEEAETYRNILKEEGYVSYSRSEKNEAKEGEVIYQGDVPHIIEYEEFGEIDTYETLSLTYYADGTLTDDRDDPMENVEFAVGSKNLTEFKDDDDVIYVRNHKLQIDFEITRDHRKYSDVYSINGLREDD